MTIDEQYRKLEDTIRDYNPGADFAHIRSAYEFAKQQHGDQRRSFSISFSCASIRSAASARSSPSVMGVSHSFARAHSACSRNAFTSS